ncbi:general substrate transporter [Aspergillus egyptiacus]|nr:general substrate transporter [Aspergillus egyptiacus]
MTSYTQLPQEFSDSDTNAPASRQPQSSLRIYWLTAVVCFGGLLFGYDSGVIGGVLTFDSFRRDFRYTADTQTRISAIAVGIQQAGALAGCLLIWPLTNRHGRRKAVMLCSAIFCLGVVFEIMNTHSILVFYVGRVICGLGVGGSATVTPIYLAEMSPNHLRARLGSGYQFTFTIGIFISYWIDYALQFRPATPAQWQIPLALQLVPGALMGLGMLTLHESVRWLLANAKHHEAWTSLVWIRGATASDSNSMIAAEFAEMKHAVAEDNRAAAAFHPRELLHRPSLHRISLAVALFVSQQATGATAMAYFGPQFFSLLVGDNDSNEYDSTSLPSPLLLTGILGALKVLSCLFFILFIADRFGRKPLLSLGAAGMSLCLIATSLLLKFFHPLPNTSSTSNSSSPSLIATLLPILPIYTTIALYNASWGPLPWPLVAEYFPTRLRSPGVAIAVASQWFSNFVWSFSTPYILRGMGWATFLLFGGFDLLILGFVVGFVPETRGLSLEGVQRLFEVEAEGEEREREGLMRDVGYVSQMEEGEDEDDSGGRDRIRS